MTRKGYKKHEHLIKEWLNGAPVQFKAADIWYDTEEPSWEKHVEFRIKPREEFKGDFKKDRLYRFDYYVGEKTGEHYNYVAAEYDLDGNLIREYI